MSYCRFRNTLSDLRDCYENIWDDLADMEEHSLEEYQARKRLIELCQNIAADTQDYNDE